MNLGEVALEELHQIVREAEQVRLHGFRGRGTGPSLFRPELVFEFVKDLFQIPAAKVGKRLLRAAT